MANDTNDVIMTSVNSSLMTVPLGDNLTSVLKNVSASAAPWYDNGRVQIPLYSVIFLLAVIGNSLVILTLVQNQRMRTITNVFLLNLAVSDLLLGVLCMPFTLVGTLLRDFIFGEIMCKFLPFLQAASVSVSAWTLVAMSVERYYAICHPLRSRRWQTLSHSYRLIAVIWGGSLVCMAPIAVLSQLIPTSKGHHKCRENWPSIKYERIYNLFLDVILLVLPLVIMAATYSLITRTLWRGMRAERAFKNHQATHSNGAIEVYINSRGTSRCSLGSRRSCRHSTFKQLKQKSSQESENNDNSSQNSYHLPPQGLRRTNAEKSLLNKKRVIQMLFVVVLEFFICWTPLYVINTIALFNPSAVYSGLGYTAISFFQLLAYSSSCCNPITYCFMNCGFRKSFLNLFRCFKTLRDSKRLQSEQVSEVHLEHKWSCKYVSEPL